MLHYRQSMFGRDRGFSTVEVLVAILVLGLVSVAVTGLAFLVTRISIEVEQETVALGIANEKIEYIRSIAYEDVGVIEGEDNDPDNLSGILHFKETMIRNSRLFTVKTNVTTEDPSQLQEGDLKKVRIEVTWPRIVGGSGKTLLITLVAPTTNMNDYDL